jgi:hypothetical protein
MKQHHAEESADWTVQMRLVGDEIPNELYFRLRLALQDEPHARIYFRRRNVREVIIHVEWEDFELQGEIDMSEIIAVWQCVVLAHGIAEDFRQDRDEHVSRRATLPAG